MFFYFLKKIIIFFNTKKYGSILKSGNEKRVKILFIEYFFGKTFSQMLLQIELTI